MDLENAARLLKAGELEAYLKELGRLIRFYLRHRLRRPEDELTLGQAMRESQKALLRSQESAAKAEVLADLEILLFSGVEAAAAQAEKAGSQLRGLILALEREARWSPSDRAQAELDQAFETLPYPAYAAKARQLGQGLLEQLGEQAEARQLAALDLLGPAAAARVKALMQARRPGEDFDPDKTHKDFKRYIEALHNAQALDSGPTTKR